MPADAVEATLNDLSSRIDRLKILYEQYFIGLEKAEPTVARKEVMRIFDELRQLQIRNTALKFRYNTLVQRWNAYVTRWGKTLREIELGTYDRHVARARRKGIELPPELARKPGSSSHPPPPGAQAADLPSPWDDAALAGLMSDIDESPAFTPKERAQPAMTIAPPRAAAAPPTVNRERAITPPPLPPERPRTVTRPPPPPSAAQKPGSTQPIDPAYIEEIRRGPAKTPPNPLERARRPSVPPPPFRDPDDDERQRSITPPPIVFDEPRARTPPAVAQAPARPRPPAPLTLDEPRVPRAAREPIPGMSEGELRSLHERYAAARRGVGANPVQFEALVATLKKQVPDLLAKHRCNTLSFDVTVREGKVILKATPKK